MISFITGFIAGTIHVFSGPDHLAAVTPISLEQNKFAGFVGLSWGFGHTFGVIILGSILITFSSFIPIEKFSNISEKLVGVLLILIGLWGIKTALTKKIHIHTHTHDDKEHSHLHFHSSSIKKEKHLLAHHKHLHAAFGIGVIHGLAGTSHIWGIIPALSFIHYSNKILYLLAFGVATILSMFFYTSLLGYFSNKIVEKNLNLFPKLLFFLSSISITIGIYWIVNINLG